jgi:integrase/recombinase XerD
MKRKPKHLPVDQWPTDDIEAFAKAYAPGDIFDETAGPGAHLADGTRRLIQTAWRRLLGWFTASSPAALSESPADRLTPERMRAFVDHCLAETSVHTVAINVAHIYYGEKIIAPERDWSWLRHLKGRLVAGGKPRDRFEGLVAPWQTLSLGIELMDAAVKLPTTSHKRRELLYRDGLLLAVLSQSLLRRRSIAALTVSRHVEITADGINILLFAEDTKAKRAENVPLLEEIVPYLMQYLKQIRPQLLGGHAHDALWVSFRGCPLTAGGIYDAVRARVLAKFGKAMGLHDFRRAGATFLAIAAPDQIGLIPSILHHTSPEVGERHYNLAGSIQASRRHSQHVASLKAKLKNEVIRV